MENLRIRISGPGSVLALAILTALAVALGSAPEPARAGEVLKFGAASPILGSVRAAQNARGKPMAADINIDLDRAGRQDVHNAVEAVAEKLEGTDLVTVDLKSAKPDKEMRLVAKAAQSRGIPFVLENCTVAEMAQLFGLGVEGDVVIVKSDGDRTQISVINRDPSKGVRASEAPTGGAAAWELSPAEKEARRPELERRQKENGGKPLPPDKVLQEEAPALGGPMGKPAIRSAAELGQMVDAALQEKPEFGPRTRGAGADISKQFYSVRMLSYAPWPKYYLNNPTGASFVQSYDLEVELIATKYPRRKYVRFVTRGAGMTPYKDSGHSMPGMDFESSTVQGYHNRRAVFTVEPNATYNWGSGWAFSVSDKIRLLEWEPKSVNGVTSFSKTTGITYTAGGEVNSGGSGISGGIQATDTQEISYDTRDISTLGSVFGTKQLGVMWDNNNNYYTNVWKNIGSSLCYNYALKSMNDLGKSTFRPEHYAVWKVDLAAGENFTDYVQFTANATAVWHLYWMASRTEDWLTGCDTRVTSGSDEVSAFQQMGVGVYFGAVSVD